MQPDQYIRQIIDKYSISGGRTLAASAAAEGVYRIIETWAGSYLLEVSYSGSGAKGTAIAGLADVDLFISLKPETPGSLADIYNSLADFHGLKEFNPKRQNVSVGVKYANHSIDLVPGRKQIGNTTDHSLYRSKAGTWTQTNVAKHVSLVQNCQRLDEIRAFKIWRALHDLEFPSFYLELTVIEALRGRRVGALAANVVTVLEYLRDNFESAAVVDSVNTNNKLSDELTLTQKSSVAFKAANCLKGNWGQLIW